MIYIIHSDGSMREVDDQGITRRQPSDMPGPIILNLLICITKMDCLQARLKFLKSEKI